MKTIRTFEWPEAGIRITIENTFGVPTVEPALNDLIVAFCTTNSISINTIRGPCRTANVMDCRRRLMLFLAKEGYDRATIAEALNRHKATIAHQLNPRYATKRKTPTT